MKRGAAGWARRQGGPDVRSGRRSAPTQCPELVGHCQAFHERQRTSGIGMAQVLDAA